MVRSRKRSFDVKILRSILQGFEVYYKISCCSAVTKITPKKIFVVVGGVSRFRFQRGELDCLR